jgi:hypothetical protein
MNYENNCNSAPFDSDETDSSQKKRRVDDAKTQSVTSAMHHTDVSAGTNCFITKIYQMLKHSNPDVIAWTDAGDQFIVNDQSRLAFEYFPLYFTHTNFKSFTRQLNFYGFNKIFSPVKIEDTVSNIGPIVNMNEKHFIFHHENFHRDHPEWLTDIKRSTKTLRSDPEHDQLIDELRKQVAILERHVVTIAEDFNAKVTAVESNCKRKLSMMATYIDRFSSTQDSSNNRNFVNTDVLTPPFDDTPQPPNALTPGTSLSLDDIERLCLF